VTLRPCLSWPVAGLMPDPTMGPRRTIMTHKTGAVNSPPKAVSSLRRPQRVISRAGLAPDWRWADSLENEIERARSLRAALFVVADAPEEPHEEQHIGGLQALSDRSCGLACGQ